MYMGDLVLQDLKKRMEDAVEMVGKDLATVRTGRAKPALLESLKAEVYGSYMELREVASITAPDPSLLVVSPWDKTIVDNVVKAIRESDLGLNPVKDAGVIKVPVPSLTEERRKELARLVAQKVESGRVMMRQLRGEAKDEIEKLKGESGVSEDDIHRWLEEMQKITDEYTEIVEKLGEEKEQDLLTL